MDMAKPFTIISFPRSGTRWIAKMLNDNGIPCRHEHMHPDDNWKIPPLTHNVITWWPCQWAQHWRLSKTTIVHTTRDPYDIIRSWPTFQPYNIDYVYHTMERPTFELAWTEFSSRALVAANGVHFKVEDIVSRWDEFVEALGYPGTTLKYVVENTFHTRSDWDVYDTIEIQENALFEMYRRKLGYE
jgi:hypothetical protein